MDPNVTLSEMIDAIVSGDVDTARERWADLQEWIGRGGFLPADPRTMVQGVQVGNFSV